MFVPRYTVGKVPKAFKIIPNLKNWEDVLWLTNPEGWSPHAMYEVSCQWGVQGNMGQRHYLQVWSGPWTGTDGGLMV
jgi:essential nuclear protein 1